MTEEQRFKNLEDNINALSECMELQYTSQGKNVPENIFVLFENLKGMFEDLKEERRIIQEIEKEISK